MRKRPGIRASGSGEALAAWYDAYAGGLYRYALIVLADHAAAEDVVQQVFTKLLGRSPARLDAPERYLRRAVRNECYTRLARRGADRPPDEGDRRLLEAADPTDGIDRAERLALEAALAALPPEQREVVVMKVYEGRTLQEIADETEVPVNTVASRYRYALEKLRLALGAPVEQS